MLQPVSDGATYNIKEDGVVITGKDIKVQYNYTIQRTYEIQNFKNDEVISTKSEIENEKKSEILDSSSYTVSIS